MKVKRLKINIASAVELASLPSVGNKKAQAIVKYRTENGDFNSVKDLAKVGGISEKLAIILDSYCDYESSFSQNLEYELLNSKSYSLAFGAFIPMCFFCFLFKRSIGISLNTFGLKISALHKTILFFIRLNSSFVLFSIILFLLSG